MIYGCLHGASNTLRANLTLPLLRDARIAAESQSAPYDESYYYGAAYRDYDKQNPEYKIAYYARLMMESVAHLERPRVLDIGCAMGYVLRRLPKNWTRVGVDASAYAIAEATKALPDATFLNQTTPPSDANFDLVTAFDVIEHVVDYEKMIARIDGILAPDGRVIFVVPVFDGPLGPIVRMLDYDVTHHNKWSRNAWLDLVSETFDLESWTGIFRYLTPAGYVHFGTDLLRGCAPAILLVAKKRASVATR